MQYLYSVIQITPKTSSRASSMYSIEMAEALRRLLRRRGMVSTLDVMNNAFVYAQHPIDPGSTLTEDRSGVEHAWGE